MVKSETIFFKQFVPEELSFNSFIIAKFVSLINVSMREVERAECESRLVFLE